MTATIAYYTEAMAWRARYLSNGRWFFLADETGQPANLDLDNLRNPSHAATEADRICKALDFDAQRAMP